MSVATKEVRYHEHQTKSEKLDALDAQFHEVIEKYPDLAQEVMADMLDAEQREQDAIAELVLNCQHVEKEIQRNITGAPNHHPDLKAYPYDEYHRRHHADPYSSQQRDHGRMV